MFRTTPRALILIVLVSLLASAFLFGCASTVPDEEPAPAPVDTTGFSGMTPEDEPEEPKDTLPSVEEQERQRLEEQRLAEQRRRQQEQRDKQSLRVVNFEYDASTLTARARQDLRHNAEMLREYPAWTVIVEGHCDERGSTEYNLALGERRAYAVKQYYVDYGIQADRIRLISYGEERPVATGSNEAAWAQNRRAVTTAR